MMKFLWCGLFVLLGLLGSGCSSTGHLDSVDAGRTYQYVPGVPNFDLEAIATWRGRSSGVDVYLSIPYNSLSFLQSGEQFSSEFEVIVQLLDEKGEAVLMEETSEHARLVATYDSTQMTAPFVLEQRLSVAAGTYIVQASLEDKTGGETAYRAQLVRVVDLVSAEPSQSRIRLEGRDGDEPFQPLLAAHLPLRLDSLRAVVELYNAPSRVEVQMVLLHPDTESDPAEPPYWFQIRDQRYVYQGVDYRRGDTLQISRRTLTSPADEITVEFTLPALPIGVYRIEISTDLDGQGETLVERRDFTVKDDGFPEVTKLDEMIESLVYIARPRELRPMLEAQTLEEKRKAFEAFWLRVGKSPTVASDLIDRYYSRVEEANKLFTSHKAGWKTDQGMVYIVLGPPNYVDRRFGEGRRLSVWRYPPPKRSRAGYYYPTDPNQSPVSQMETRYIFEEARKIDRDIPYPQYILRRNRIYQQLWEDAVNLWRSGRVL